MDDLGKTIKLLRQERGWSQNDFAGKLGISVPAFSKIENGLTDLHLSRLKNIADVLGMTLIELMAYKKSATVSEANELQEARQSIKNYMGEILHMQKQIISLHEEIRRLQSKNS